VSVELPLSLPLLPPLLSAPDEVSPPLLEPPEPSEPLDSAGPPLDSLPLPESSTLVGDVASSSAPVVSAPSSLPPSSPHATVTASNAGIDSRPYPKPRMGRS
jgi:hypothetical protein